MPHLLFFETPKATGVADGGGGGASTEHSAECDTLVGRLAGLLLDRTKPDVPDLHEVRVDQQKHSAWASILESALVSPSQSRPFQQS